MKNALKRTVGVMIGLGLSLCTGSSIAQTLTQKGIIATNTTPINTSFRGQTAGDVSLSFIANTDNQGKACLGYGDPSPDYVMELNKTIENLQIKINSGGQGTTLVVKGPNWIRCDFGTTDNPDAIISAENLRAGTYEIWVGSFEQGQTINYNLSIQGQ